MSAAINCLACNRLVPQSGATHCPECGAPLHIVSPHERRPDGLESWGGWHGLAASQTAAMSYWFMARQDHAQLRALLETPGAPDDPGRRLLAAKLDRGLVADADQLPRDVVTIGSRIEFLFRGERGHCVLADPARRADGHSLVSPLRPFGAILFGMPEGRALRAQDPDGASFTLHIQSVQQPEALRARSEHEARQRKLAS